MEKIEEIKKRYESVLSRIQKASIQSGRGKVPRLLAVSKRQALSSIGHLYHCGHRCFAENYLQELEEKRAFFESQGLGGVTWSFVGRLQSNKIKRIVACSDEIQSVESLKQAKLIARFSSELKKAPFPVYLLVNLGAETTKAGVLLSDVDALAREIFLLKTLSLKGLMAIPPRFSKDPEGLKAQRRLYLDLANKSRSVGRGSLSLGMSSDLEQAISCGSDCVRVGTDLFGPRS